MANTEVGAAYVSILPSLKGFTKSLQRELKKQLAGSDVDRMLSDAFANARVRLPVEPVVDDVGRLDQVEVPVRPDRSSLDDLQDSVRDAAADVRAFVAVGPDGTTFGRLLREEVDRADDGVRAQVGADVDTGGLLARLRESVRAASRSVVAQVRVEFDRERLDVDVRDAIGRIRVDRDGGRLGVALAGSTASSFGSAIQDAIRIPLQSLGNNQFVSTIGGALGAGLAVAASTAFGAAFTGALLGGAGLGLIGIGAIILREEPEVANAANRLAATVSSVFKSAAEPLIGPISEALETIRWAVIEWGPQFREMFSLIAPAIKPLTEGLIGLVSNMLPGFTELIRNATPFLISLAEQLPRLGEFIGVFFRIIDGGGPEASLFFKDLVTVVGLLVVGIGVVIRTLTTLYPLFRFLIAESPVGMFIGFVKTLYDTRDALGSVIETGKRVVDVFGKAWQVAIADAKRKGGELIEFVKGLPGRIARGLGNPSGLLYGAGRAIIQGLINGIKAMIPSLQGTLAWVTSMLPEWKGPMDRDRVLLEPSGTAIMGGLIRGIHGERRALEAELGSVTSLIGGSPLTTPAAGFGASAPAAPAPVATVRFVGDAPGSFMEWIRENTRVEYGGSAQAAIGTGRG